MWCKIVKLKFLQNYKKIERFISKLLVRSSFFAVFSMPYKGNFFLNVLGDCSQIFTHVKLAKKLSLMIKHNFVVALGIQFLGIFVVTVNIFER